MSKKSRFRGPFDKQYGNCAQALFKSASQHLYHIHWSRPRKFSWKKSLLFRSQILGLLVNTLAVMASILFLIETCNDTNADATILETKTFFSIFCCIFEIWINF